MGYAEPKELLRRCLVRFLQELKQSKLVLRDLLFLLFFADDVLLKAKQFKVVARILYLVVVDSDLIYVIGSVQDVLASERCLRILFLLVIRCITLFYFNFLFDLRGRTRFRIRVEISGSYSFELAFPSFLVKSSCFMKSINLFLWAPWALLDIHWAYTFFLVSIW